MHQRTDILAVLLELQQPTNRVPLHISADGRKLAMTTQWCRRATDLGRDRSYTLDGVPRGMLGSRVLVVDTASGEVEEPFPVGSTSWSAQWSPDGTRLAAYIQHEGQACLGVWERTNRSLKLFPQALVRPFFGFEVPRWTPDSQALVVKLVASPIQDTYTTPAPARAKGTAVTVFSFVPGAEVKQDSDALPGWADGYRCDLAVVDVRTGNVQHLAENWRIIGWKMAPDGNAVAVLRYTEMESRLQQFYFTLMVLPLDGGAPRLLARRIPQAYGVSLSWSPDSSSLAYTTQERGATSGLFVVAADGSTEPRALHDPRQELELVGDVEAPRWSEDGRRVYCVAKQGCWEFATDGSTRRQISIPPGDEVLGWVQPSGTATVWMPEPETLLFVMRSARTKETGLLRLDLQSGEGTMLSQRAERTGWLPFEGEVAPDGSAFYLTLEASTHPAEIWQFARDAQPQRRLYAFHAGLENVPLGTSRLLEYRTLDGKRRQAALLLPAGYQEGQMVPVVVEVYGGSMGSSYLHSFGGSHAIVHGQLLASHGYAVLSPDMPMEDRDPMKQGVGSVLPALIHLIDSGIADPRRIGLIGQSYGGYCALSLLTQTNLFAAAVVNAGCYNVVSAYLTLDEEGNDDWLGWVETGQGRMGGKTLWEKRESYIENSPIFYLDRVQTPVLVTCGARDLGAPAQAEALFVGLRRLGKPVEMRRYERERHWPGAWSAQGYQDLAHRVLAWFNEYLKE